jgi:penicillin-binding protein 2
VAVGQSFALVTPIQMVRFISAVFNGGILFRPQVTKSVGKEGNDDVFEFTPDIVRRWSLKEEHIELIKRALYGVVNEPGGTGHRARIDNIKVAGKTGTAQVIALPEEGGQMEKEEIPYKYRDHAWFVAVAPWDRPTIAISILIEHGGMGGATAAPIAGEILGEYFAKQRGS